ncbi:MAG: GDSL-type esterase/lipase family protein, partial [Phycisphaeraceae bacterium]
RDDALALEPTVVSILVGVNDTGHAALADSERHVPLPAYEKAYRGLLDALPEGARVVLGEPFALKAGPVTDGWIVDVRKRASLVRQLAGEYDAVFVPYQQMFDDALKLAGPDHWMPDGFHPSPAGHMLMARAWLERVHAAAPTAGSV